MWLVRLLLGACLFLRASSAGQSQQTTATEEAISKIIDLGLFRGHDSKVIGESDAAAWPSQGSRGEEPHCLAN